MTIEDILPLVEGPSQYLGSEINSIKKDHSKTKMTFALSFPDVYEIGTSHFGMQILYHILNSRPQIAAERVFAPNIDMEDYIRANNIPLFSLESKKAVKDFDIVGFSLLYEMNYTNVINMLNMAQIPFFSKERDITCPIIIAGGPCTVNPEPMADFFDAMVIGDGEQTAVDMADIFIDWKKEHNREKIELLKRWSDLTGVYIPCMFDGQKKITRAICKDIDSAPFPSSPIVPYAKTVHDRMRLEIARGCIRGCRFCQAGIIYRPVRERSVDTLVKLAKETVLNTGYDEVSLLSLSAGDYSRINCLMETLMTGFEKERIAVSFPSLRAETLSARLMKLIKKVRKTGFTIAAEAGTQRLRRVINKNLSNKDIEDTVKKALDAGWRVIKLYFMIGLPTETEEDLQAIIDLVRGLHSLRGAKGTRIDLNVSVSSFVPKAHTPFQWHTQQSLDVSKRKLDFLKDELRDISGVNFKWQDPRLSLLEGLFARGDRSLSKAIVRAWEKGCKFDGWSDKFKYDKWQEAILETGIDIDYYMSGKKLEDNLPWDHIDARVSRQFLIDEWEKAFKEMPTEPCNIDRCGKCGVCGAQNIKPSVSRVPDVCEEKTDSPVKNQDQGLYRKVQVSYTKEGDARFFGHLEMISIFTRALRRAGIELKYSKGFHPLPKLVFEDALPVGMESAAETLFVYVSEDVTPFFLMYKLNKQVPAGIKITDCRYALKKMPQPKSLQYSVSLSSGFFDSRLLAAFNKKESCIFTRAKGKQTDLKDAVVAIELASPKQPDLRASESRESDADLYTLAIMELKPGIRPIEAAKEIFALSDKQASLARAFKRAVSFN